MVDREERKGGREEGGMGGRTRDKIKHPKGLPATFQRFQNLSK